MRHFATLALTLAAAGMIGGSAFAQSDTNGAGAASSGMSSGAMSKNGMSKDGMSKDGMSSGSMKMSKMDMKTMKKCSAMAHDAMMANGKCKTFMSGHPDMFNSDGTVKSGMAPQ